MLHDQINFVLMGNDTYFLLNVRIYGSGCAFTDRIVKYGVFIMNDSIK